MIHLAQDEHVEIADVAGQEERHDLTPTVLELLVAAGPAVEDQVHPLRPLAFAHDIDARCKIAHALGRGSVENGMVGRRKTDEMLKFSNEVNQWKNLGLHQSDA